MKMSDVFDGCISAWIEPITDRLRNCGLDSKKAEAIDHAVKKHDKMVEFIQIVANECHDADELQYQAKLFLESMGEKVK